MLFPLYVQVEDNKTHPYHQNIDTWWQSWTMRDYSFVKKTSEIKAASNLRSPLELGPSGGTSAKNSASSPAVSKSTQRPSPAHTEQLIGLETSSFHLSGSYTSLQMRPKVKEGSPKQDDVLPSSQQPSEETQHM